MAEAILRREIDIRDWQLWCLPAAILVYAFRGTPTPERVGWPELVIGLLLAAAVGLPRAAQAFALNQGAPWERTGKVLLVYGLSLPLFIGLLASNSLSGIIRDVVPFLFLLLPVFVYPLWHGKAQAIKFLTGAVAALGLIFALRVLLPAYMSFSELQPASLPDPFRLANAPTVLFAALLLAGIGGVYLYRLRLAPGLLLAGLSIIPLLTMALISQRASIGVFCLSMAFLLALGLWRRPLRMLLPLAVLGAALALGWPLAEAAGQALLRKNAIVGMNMRWQETAAVMEALGGSFASVLFGKGWGAAITSPAVGGDVVNFTHSLLTTYWLKTGLVGLGFALAYLYRFALMLLEILLYKPVVALALAGPFAIDILLYANFKSFGFGLVLLLIPLWAADRDSLQKKRSYCMQKEIS